MALSAQVGQSFFTQGSKFVRPGCGLMCGHPFPNHRVAVIITGLEPSSSQWFPSNVKEVSSQYLKYLIQII